MIQKFFFGGGVYMKFYKFDFRSKNQHFIIGFQYSELLVTRGLGVRANTLFKTNPKFKLINNKLQSKPVS